MSDILTCPQCGFIVEDPRAGAVPDSTLATCHKCRTKSPLSDWRPKVAMAHSAPPPPVADGDSTSEPSSAPASTPSIPFQDGTTIAGQCVAVVGLLLLTASYFLNWFETAWGGTLGISDHGVILFGGSVIALAAVVLAALINRWWAPLLSFSEGWTLFIATWCVVLFRRFDSIPAEPQIQQFYMVPAVAASAMLKPGAGLYLALVGSVIACIAIAYVCGRRLIPAMASKFAISQIAIGVGSIALALLLLPEQDQSRPITPASLYEQITAEMPTHPRTTSPSADAPLFAMGMSYVLGNLEITPKEFTREVLQESHVFGKPEPRTVESIVFTFTAKNISEGQVFPPASEMVVVDEHGNRCPNPLERQLISKSINFDQSGIYTTLQPGETATVKLVFDPAFENATEYTCEVTTAVSNSFDRKRWRIVYRPEADSP